MDLGVAAGERPRAQKTAREADAVACPAGGKSRQWRTAFAVEQGEVGRGADHLHVPRVERRTRPVDGVKAAT
jgi:hypothetical protein